MDPAMPAMINTNGNHALEAGVWLTGSSKIREALELLSSGALYRMPFCRNRKAVTSHDSCSVRLPGFQNGIAAEMKPRRLAAVPNFRMVPGPTRAGIVVGSVNPF